MRPGATILAGGVGAGIVAALIVSRTSCRALEDQEHGRAVVPGDDHRAKSKELSRRSDAGWVVAGEPGDSRPEPRMVEPRLTVRLYTVDGERAPDAEAYSLVLAVADQGIRALQEAVERRSRLADVRLGRFAVVEQGKRRASLAAGEFLCASLERILQQLPHDRDDLWCSVREAGTGRAVPALLVADDGRPFGPIEQLRQRIAVSSASALYAVASGYLPAPLQVVGAEASAFLHRAARARGRVGGAPFQSGRLWFRHLGPDPRGLTRMSEAVELGADGSFEIGPIAAGDKYLMLEAEGAWMSSASRRVTLFPGHQDLGVLIADPLYGLHLAVRDETGQPYDGELFTWIYFSERDVTDFLGTKHVISGGLLTLPKYRGDVLDLWAWTADGRLGSATGVRAAATSANVPLAVTLRAPGSVVVQVSVAPFDLPSGCSLLVSANEYYLARHALLHAGEDRPEQRVRSFPVPPSGLVSVPRLWAGRAQLALVSPSGAALAGRWIEVQAGAATYETVAPAAPLAALRVEGPTDGRRFAVISDTVGIVLRGRATPDVHECLLTPGSYRVRCLEPGVGSQNAVFEVGAGEVKSVRVD